MLSRALIRLDPALSSEAQVSQALARIEPRGKFCQCAYHLKASDMVVAEELPTSQLVEIWNALPGVTPVRKFKDRATAISRIWKSVSELECVSQAEGPGDAAPGTVEVDGPVIEAPVAEAEF